MPTAEEVPTPYQAAPAAGDAEHALVPTPSPGVRSSGRLVGRALGRPVVRSSGQAVPAAGGADTPGGDALVPTPSPAVRSSGRPVVLGAGALAPTLSPGAPAAD